MAKLIKLLIFSLLLSWQSKGQDVQFSQIFSDKLYLNPAYAGTDYCPKLNLIYRNQWPGVQIPFVTYAASIDKYVPALSGGVGFRIMNDKQGAGVFNQLNADFIYSYYAKMSQNLMIRFAIQGSIFQRTMNTSDLVFNNMIDPAQGVLYPNLENMSNETFLSPDISFATLFNYKKYFLGVTANHLPIKVVDNHSEYLPFKITAHAGAAIPLDFKDKKQSKLVLEPNIVYINQQDMNMLFYGMYFDVNNMSLGLFYRQNLRFHFDAMIMSYHLKVKNLTFAYSFDLQLSRFIGHTMGSHEISLGYLFSCNEKIRNYNTISCPSF